MPGTYDLVLERSRSGTGDGDFHFVTRIEQVTPGAPFDCLDTPVAMGQLGMYRARYECRADPSVVSDWAYTTGRGGYPAGEASMGDVVTSASVALAISAPERNPGQGNRAVSYLDFSTQNLSVQRGYADSSANRNTVAETADEGSAITRLSGSAGLDFRPGGGFLRILETAYYLNLADVTTVPLNGTAAAHNKHKLKLSYKRRPATLLSKEGDFAFVYAGAQLSRLRYSADKTQTTKIRADVDLVALGHAVYDASTDNALALLGLDTASYDLTSALNPTDWALYMDGVQAPCSRHSVDFGFNPTPKDVGNNHMGSSAFYALKSSISGQITNYFESLDDFKAYYGQDAAALMPFGVKKTIRFREVRIVYLPPANGDGYVNSVTLVFPRCSLRSVTKEIPENGAVMQQIDFKPIQDPTQGRIDHYWEIECGETFANMTDFGREIGYAPKQDLFPYYAIPGVVSAAPAPTTTVIAADAQFLGDTYLSAVDGAYIGKTLRFTVNASSPNAGQTRNITGYTAATRTFTLSAALPAAPSAGDTFQILFAEKG